MKILLALRSLAVAFLLTTVLVGGGVIHCAEANTRSLLKHGKFTETREVY